MISGSDKANRVVAVCAYSALEDSASVTRLPIHAEFVPVIWLHKKSGRVTTGFAGQGKRMVILTLASFGLRIAYLPRVAVLFGALG